MQFFHIWVMLCAQWLCKSIAIASECLSKLNQYEENFVHFSKWARKKCVDAFGAILSRIYHTPGNILAGRFSEIFGTKVVILEIFGTKIIIFGIFGTKIIILEFFWNKNCMIFMTFIRFYRIVRFLQISLKFYTFLKNFVSFCKILKIFFWKLNF